MPTDTGDLAGHRFIAPRHEDRRLPFWPWIKRHVRPEQIALSSPDIWVNEQAIFQGLGMGFLAEYRAAQHPEMQPVFGQTKRWFVHLWLATHVDLHRTDKVQAMHKLIKSEFDISTKDAPTGSKP